MSSFLRRVVTALRTFRKPEFFELSELLPCYASYVKNVLPVQQKIKFETVDKINAAVKAS